MSDPEFNVIALQNGFDGATFSPCRRYRYTLWRVIPWENLVPRPARSIAFIGLNPSTADHEKNDPTVHRCLKRATDWGYGKLWMLNLFPYRATDPKDLKRCSNPEGPSGTQTEHANEIRGVLQEAETIICAWGSHGTYKGAGQFFKDIILAPFLSKTYCLGTTKAGHPRHPLYLSYDVQPQKWP